MSAYNSSSCDGGREESHRSLILPGWCSPFLLAGVIESVGLRLGLSKRRGILPEQMLRMSFARKVLNRASSGSPRVRSHLRLVSRSNKHGFGSPLSPTRLSKRNMT